MPIHPTAIIDPRADLHDSVQVGPHCVIDANVRMGAGCRLYHNVYVSGWTEIGEGCELHPGVIVGHAPQDTKYKGERSFCRIGPRTILREYVTIHRGTVPESETVVGADCFLLGGSHVAHNCRLGDSVTLINNVLLAGHVQIADRVTIGGGSGVHQFVRIGELAMVSGNGRVPMDVVPYALLDVEGRVAGLNRIGMRRSKISREDFADVRDAYRLLFGSGIPFREAVARLQEVVRTPSGRRIAEFLQGNSQRGIAGRSRRRAQGSASSGGEE
ncbi:MAG: acyl-ACP--UDP-N-acetylglucosamine O-acyltransferase [Planctomycetota bacterium]